MKVLHSLLGVVIAMFSLGTQAGVVDGMAAYEAGDYVTAMREIMPLARDGSPYAQGLIGYMYDEGQGVAEDRSKAAEWYRKAAVQGNSFSQFRLGALYQTGDGVQQDDREAVMWYRKAAAQGDADAQNNLGAMLEDGRGVVQSYQQAAKWYRKAALQGHAGGENNLGILYDKGLGVRQDRRQAANWYRKAAKQGAPLAVTNLGVKYANGEGVNESRVVAYALWKWSAERQTENGNRAKEFLECLGEVLTDGERQEASLLTSNVVEAEDLFMSVDTYLKARPALGVRLKDTRPVADCVKR